MRETVVASAALFIAFLLLTMPFLGTEALYLALLGAFVPQVLRVVRGDSWSSPYGSNDESGPTSIWDSVPREQYTGRFAEAGGITRQEQEQALDDIEQQAQVEERHEPYGR
ncbi:hypothetical protein [Halomarina rubra]|uniref:Uncharacterized protein n=1 Tax=Halomarina rubra TaxID=2071873 RepID=A0ABD6AZG3_9EURY|nr:hypothetical protein [Halomarina rubra]